MTLSYQSYNKIIELYRECLRAKEVTELAGFPFFAGMSRAQVSGLFTFMTKLKPVKNESIYRRGDKDRNLYFITEGEVQITRPRSFANHQKKQAKARLLRKWTNNANLNRRLLTFHSQKVEKTDVLGRGSVFGDWELALDMALEHRVQSAQALSYQNQLYRLPYHRYLEIMKCDIKPFQQKKNIVTPQKR